MNFITSESTNQKVYFDFKPNKTFGLAYFDTIYKKVNERFKS